MSDPKRTCSALFDHFVGGHTRTLGLFPASRCSGGKATRYFVALREAVHGPKQTF